MFQLRPMGAEFSLSSGFQEEPGRSAAVYFSLDRGERKRGGREKMEGETERSERDRESRMPCVQLTLRGAQSRSQHEIEWRPPCEWRARTPGSPVCVKCAALKILHGVVRRHCCVVTRARELVHRKTISKQVVIENRLEEIILENVVINIWRPLKPNERIGNYCLLFDERKAPDPKQLV
jgi:hypothetical protein